MSFIGLFPNFNPPALDLMMSVTQGQLLTIYLLLNIEDNSPAPLSLSISSEKPVANWSLHTFSACINTMALHKH